MSLLAGNPWPLLLIAACFEVAFAITLKLSDGFSKLYPTIATLSTGAASLVFLSLALKQLPVGVAYSAWTGLGAIGTVLVSVWLLDEQMTMLKAGCLSMIIVGVVGLNVTGNTP